MEQEIIMFMISEFFNLSCGPSLPAAAGACIK